MFSKVRKGLVDSGIDATLVDELLAAYVDAKRSFYLGGLRLSEVEGGRFCEAAYRILEEVTAGSFTPLGRTLDTDAVSQRLANLKKGSHPDSVRLHIPRALRVVYDVRNNRDAAHLGDSIDPNLQDATLVGAVIDWVLAEFVRLYHSVTADEAQRLVEGVVTRRAPAIQDFNGFLKVLNPRLTAGDRVLLLLYQRGQEGASFEELNEWMVPHMRPNLRRTLARLTHTTSEIHYDGTRYVITRTGLLKVEKKKMYALPADR